jgi:hypothetical protein
VRRHSRSRSTTFTTCLSIAAVHFLCVCYGARMLECGQRATTRLHERLHDPTFQRSLWPASAFRTVCSSQASQRCTTLSTSSAELPPLAGGLGQSEVTPRSSTRRSTTSFSLMTPSTSSVLSSQRYAKRTYAIIVRGFCLMGDPSSSVLWFKLLINKGNHTKDEWTPTLEPLQPTIDFW